MTTFPEEFAHVVEGCLAGDSADRWQSATDVRRELEWVARSRPVKAQNLPSRRASIGAIATAAFFAAVPLTYWWMSPRPNPAPLQYLNVDFGEDAALSTIRSATIALSPDGSRVVFTIGQPIANGRLATRRLNQPNAVRLAGTEGAEHPFFSPDGKFIAFFSDGKLKKIDADGGEPVTLCDAPTSRGGDWGEDDRIVFAPQAGGLLRVGASGGTPETITRPDPKQGDSFTHRYPQVLPNAKAVVFVNGLDAAGEGSIIVQSLETGKRKTLARGAYPRYLPSGHLVFIHRRVLLAAPMDLNRLDLTGPAAPILENVGFEPSTGAAGFAFSKSGLFVYVAQSPDDRLRPIVVVNEQGKAEPLPVDKARYGRPRVSPDGSRLAVAIEDGSGTHLWIYDWKTQRLSRLPSAAGNSKYPVWSSDGKALVFFSDIPAPGIYWARADGAGEAQRLVEGSQMVPTSISGSRLLYAVEGGEKAGLWVLALDLRDASHPRAGAAEHFPNAAIDSPASFSPDERWLTYSGIVGDGMPQVMVRPYPGGGGPWQVSAPGGVNGIWSRASREIFYEGKPVPNIMVAGYSAEGDSFSPGQSRVWSEMRVESFDMMPDGKRAVVIPAPMQQQATHATFLLNFMEDLHRRVPPGK